jgi:hypothetical protein
MNQRVGGRQRNPRCSVCRFEVQYGTISLVESANQIDEQLTHEYDLKRHSLVAYFDSICPLKFTFVHISGSFEFSK